MPGGALADRRRRGRRVDVERHRVDVAEDRPRPLVEQAVGRGDEAEGAGEDLVSLAPAERPHAEVKRRRAARHRDRVLDPEPGGELALEALAHRPERQPAGAQHLEHQLLLARRRSRAAPAGSARSHRRGWKAYSSESTSASQEASMMFSETPIVPHSRSPSAESSSTRVTAPVPWSRRGSGPCSWSARSRRGAGGGRRSRRAAPVERVHRAVALRDLRRSARRRPRP